MGFVSEFLIEGVWGMLVQAAGADKPWWVRALIFLSPLFVLAALVGCVWLLFALF